MVRVLVVDDQAPFRVAARAVLDRTEGFWLVGEAVSGAEAVTRVAELHPDMVLMDIDLGDRDGVAVTAELTTADAALVVVLISTHLVDELPSGARSCGARGYVNKAQLSPSVLRDMWDLREDPFVAPA
ncbi:MAG: response regulator transcription factor [Actinomycetota bacterium]|nr:response regulator transcription factor [Actinomycetota bacterium]